jgi:DNA-binding CsgD family transcriptional regulator
VLAELADVRDGVDVLIVTFGCHAWQGRLLLRAVQALYDAETARCRLDRDPGHAWQHAAAACRTAGLPWDEAYAQWRTAQSLLPERASRPHGAAALRRASELATTLQAGPLLESIAALGRSARIALNAKPVPVPVQTTALAGLTARKREILGHVVAGRTYREIADALVISEKTVSAHISNLLHKTGAANRIELAQLVLRLTRPAGEA